MTIEQIYSTINSIRTNMTTGSETIVNASTFVAFGNDTLSSSSNKESFYNLLVDRIGRTIIAVRKYNASGRNVTVDSFTFGSILQKISYKLQNAESDSKWQKTPQNPYTLEPKGGIIQKLFVQNMPVFQYDDVLLDDQLASAFVSASAMAGFINGLATRMSNALEISIEGMENTAIASLVGVVKEESTGESAINPRRYRNLLAEYNTAHPTATITSVESALENADFLKFACVEMGTVLPFLAKYTSMYNDGTVERFSTQDNLVLEVNSQFMKNYQVHLQSDSFNKELLALPNFKEVPYWQFPTSPQKISVKLGEGSDERTLGENHVIAIMRDKDACVCTLDKERTVSKYDEWNARTYMKMEAERRFIVDTSENCVVFYMSYTAPTE